jgi:hypothetical protein
MIKTVDRLFLSGFNETLMLLTDFRKTLKYRPVGAELFHVDGQTDMTKLTVAFRNFANAPKNACKTVTTVHQV